MQITVHDLVAYELLGANTATYSIELSLPMNYYELEQTIEDVLFEGAIATHQRLEGHYDIVAITESGLELNKRELMNLNSLLESLERSSMATAQEVA